MCNKKFLILIIFVVLLVSILISIRQNKCIEEDVYSVEKMNKKSVFVDGYIGYDNKKDYNYMQPIMEGR